MDSALFGVFPYVALTVLVVGIFRRFGAARDTVTTASSQLLEGRLQYWGSVPWHYAILLVLLVHLCAIFLPRAVEGVLASPARLVVVEVTGLALGITALVGLAVLMVRRVGLRGQTSPVDLVVLVLLLVQVATGVWIAATLRWGLGWFTHLASPWLQSLVRGAPRVDLLASMPWPVKVHVVNAFLLLALAPYTRLAHAFVVPAQYLWRLPQVVVWLRLRRRGEVSR